MPNRLTRGIGLFGRVVTEAFRTTALSITAATLTLAEKHEGRTLVANRAAGITFTLPDATGSGRKFRIVVGTTVTSNSIKVQAPDADNVMAGVILGAADAGDAVNGWEAAAASDTVTLNGSTTGGLKGDVLEFEDIAADTWLTTGVIQQTGTEATPFSAAVS